MPENVENKLTKVSASTFVVLLFTALKMATMPLYEYLNSISWKSFERPMDGMGMYLFWENECVDENEQVLNEDTL